VESNSEVLFGIRESVVLVQKSRVSKNSRVFEGHRDRDRDRDRPRHSFHSVTTPFDSELRPEAI